MGRPNLRPKDLPPIKTRDEAFRAGDTYFYTGKPCMRGHLAVRYVSTNGCTACMDRHKTQGARNAFDDKLVPFFGVPGLWRPRHWDAHTLEASKLAVQTFLNEWGAANAPPPPEAEFKLRNVYGVRYTMVGHVESMDGNKYETWQPWRGHTMQQLRLRASGAHSAPTVELFTREALESPAPWVYRDLLNGDGPRWYVCEHIDFALFKVIEDHALHVAIGVFGLDGSLTVVS